MSGRCDGPKAPWPSGQGKPNSTEAGADACWFALAVRPRHEKTTASALRFKGYEEFVPLYRSRRRWSDRFKEVELPLFAGYVFCRFDSTRRVPILSTPGVVRIIGFGKEPICVPDTEVEALRAIARSGLMVEPWPFLEAGCRVAIEDGPLRGIHGTLLDINKNRERLVLSVALLRRSVAVEMDMRWVRPLPKGPASETRSLHRAATRGI